jgi:hypothetical protein
VSGITRVSVGTIVESASATSVTPSLPGSLQDGDYVVFACTVPGTSTATEVSEHSGTPSGWTQIGAPKYVNDTNIVSAYGRLKDSGWSTMPTISTTHAASRTAAASAAYRGVHGTTPLDVTAVFSGTTTNGAGATSLAMTGVTTVTDGAMLLSFCVVDSSTDTFSPTAPSGMTALVTSTGTADGTAGRGLTLAEELRATAGATGTRTWAHGASTGHGGYVFALRPGNTQTFTGSITATGALTKTVNKKFTGSSTATGALTVLKVVVKVFTGSITATGALIKRINKTLTGSTTATGAFIKVPKKVLTGTITPGPGVLRKAFPRVYTGTITPVGNVVFVALGRVFGRPGRAVMTAVKAAEAILRIRRT